MIVSMQLFPKADSNICYALLWYLVFFFVFRLFSLVFACARFVIHTKPGGVVRNQMNYGAEATLFPAFSDFLRMANKSSCDERLFIFHLEP